MSSKQQRVGAKIKSLRERAGLSLGQLAEASDINKSSIMRLERGEFSKPAPETLTALAEALGVDPAELLSAAGYVTKQALPSFKPYLRTKYGHLPAEARAELEAYFERLNAEYSPPATTPKTSTRRKGGTT